MSGRANHVEQIAAMTSMLEVAPHAVALKAHLRSITESPAFKGSRRSQEFLQFVVARALEGHFDELKERVLGVELFLLSRELVPRAEPAAERSPVRAVALGCALMTLLLRSWCWASSLECDPGILHRIS